MTDEGLDVKMYSDNRIKRLWSCCGNSNMNGQGNRVRIPDGTAAVCVESDVYDENQSLGKPEKADIR